MRKNLEIAVKFAEKAKTIKGILQIILFGSVATGEDTEKSDIDIAVVYRGDRFRVMEEANKGKADKIQTTFVDINNLYDETEIVGALSGEGILLYGHPISLQEKKVKLEAKILVGYSMVGIGQAEKVKLNRALYGSISKSTKKGKKYITTVKGLTNEPGIEKINDGVLLIERRKSKKVINLLRRFKANYKEIPVWTY